MKPNYPRPSKIPANFVFIGRGGSFTPVKNEAYYCVFESESYLNNGFTYEDPKHYSPLYDFYVKKNGPTYELNRPISKKKSKYTVEKHGISWTVRENGGIFAYAPIRESARKIAKALNQMEE